MKLVCPETTCPSNIGGQPRLFKGTVEVDENGDVLVEAKDHDDGFLCAHCDAIIVDTDSSDDDFSDHEE